MRKLVVVMLVLLGVAGAAFADEPFASYNEPGDFNVYVGAGYWWGIDVIASAEYVVGEFDLGPVPCDWGLMANGGVGFYYGGVEFGVGVLATLHMGLMWDLDFSLAAGVTAFNSYTSFPVSWAHDAAARYWFSDAMAVFVREGYVGFHYWTVGIELKI